MFSGTAWYLFSDRNIDDVPILIHCPPQIVTLASDGDKYFIDVPDVAEPSLFPAQRSSIGRSKLDAPAEAVKMRIDISAPFGLNNLVFAFSISFRFRRRPKHNKSDIQFLTGEDL
jgi:hypothetical protein